MLFVLWMVRAALAIDVGLFRYAAQWSKWSLMALETSVLTNLGDRFVVIFDTGSAWLWVNDADCSQCHPAFHRFYSSASTTYTSNGTDIQMYYGMGTAAGTLGSDLVSILPGADRVNQSFVAVHQNNGFDGMESDGLIGLGFNSLSENQQTFVENLKSQNIIDKAVFAMFLSDTDYGTNLKGKYTSMISFGEYNLTKYSDAAALVYLPVDPSTGHWAVSLDSVLLGDEEVVSGGMKAIVDSGTSLLLGPYFEVLKVFSHFPPSCEVRGGRLRCGCADDLPDLKFVLHGYSFTVTPDMYLMGEGRVCLVLLFPEYTGGLWVLGDVFIRSYYTVWDMDNLQLGLAPVKGFKQAIIKVSWPWWVLPGLTIGLLAILSFIVYWWVCIHEDESKRQSAILEPLIR